MFSSILGTVFYSIVLFIAGTVVGRPLWTWATKSLPWNK